ncbi:Coronin-like protein crn1 [Cladophialophora chaetospira]|uniref:Coronin n=1 Tax=Cladophialophora chaetospira TaxID=386627 RepID=A0AA38X8F9_9EURO|nr:Coronin-like protein crn1 [Cladophialophora chaetospira]
MAGRFVRSSKYRHVFGRPTRKEQCYDNVRVSKNAWDTNLVKANPEYLALNWDSSGGGAFAVIPVKERGRQPERIPLFRGHTAVVLDTDWNPFNDSLIASGSDDGKVFLWRVPDDFTLQLDLPADEVKDISPVGKLSGHPKKVGHVLFNPAAENVLASAAGDFTIKIWDIEAGSSKLSLKVGEVIQSLSWSANGALLVTTSRDKKLRIWDTRQEKPVHEGPGHAGAKNSRAVWMGEHDRIATTGFSRMSDRQLALWDIRAAAEPVDGFQMLDSISGVCMPFWDDGTQCLFLAGRGDGNIRYYEYEQNRFEYLSEYKSSDPQRGVAFVPKRGVNLHENEVARAYKTVNDSYIEPISFIVPRRAETFQEDIYPPTTGLKPAVSGKEWFDGADGLPPKISMESLYEGTGVQEVPAEEIKPVQKAPEPIKAVEPKKEVVEQAPEPATIRSPPPSMKEQGATMSSAADKFKDTEPAEEEEEESDFEEVQKPVERTSAVKPATVQETKKEESPTPTASKVFEDVETPESILKHRTTEKELPDEQSAENGEASNIPVASATSSSSSADQEIKNLKAILAQQSRQISSLTKTVEQLVAEVKSLKSS